MGSLAAIFADPGAASFALGGLQFKKESRISILSENLTIAEPAGADEDTGMESLQLDITADYEFLNNTDRDVTIRMAFPVPDDVCGAANSPYMVFVGDGGGNVATPFHVWVEGQEIQYSTEIRAVRSGKYLPAFPSDLGRDYADLLRSLRVDPESCRANQELSQSAKLNLVGVGLLDGENYNAAWTVRRKYYWTQTFPAKATTHIKITYPAQVGSAEVYMGPGWDERTIQATKAFWKTEISNTCTGPRLQGKLEGEMSGPDRFLGAHWMDFILVTANYWSGPIKDFVLTIQTQHPGARVSFCWDGPIKQLDATRVVASAHDFSPKRDLHIGFFEIF